MHLFTVDFIKNSYIIILTEKRDDVMLELSENDFLNEEKIKVQSFDCEPFPEHSHNFLEITYIKKGTAVNLCNGREIHLSEGSYVIIDYHTAHRMIEKSKDIEGLNCLVVPQFLEPAISNCKSFKGMLTALSLPLLKEKDIFVFQDNSEQVFKLLVKLKEELSAKQLGYRELAKTYLTQILILSLRSFQHDADNTVNNPLIEDILFYLQKNHSRKDLLKAVSREFNYSPAYVSVLFKRELGIHFNEYIRQLRIRVACDLLSSGDMSVDEIGFAVGYNNPAPFRSNFKELMRLTPTNYRRNQYGRHKA